MAVVRILVDGYSLLHGWPALARGRQRHSAAARTELLHWLRQYQDADGTPLTVVFDGAQPRVESAAAGSSPQFEVLYSKSGQTADVIIERVATRMRPYGEVLVVTDDSVERETVMAQGGIAMSCSTFIEQVLARLDDAARELRTWNRGEQRRFRRPH